MQVLSKLRFELINGINESDVENAEYAIYGHLCNDGLYIGFSGDPVKRWQEHWFDAFNENSENYSDKFRASIRKHQNNFTHYILQVAKYEKSAKNKEAEAIRFYSANLNVKPEHNSENNGFGYQKIEGQISKILVLGKQGTTGSWYSRNDSHRKPVIAEIYIERNRRRVRSIAGSDFPAGLMVECSRIEREKFNSGDLVKVNVALSTKHGKPYLVAAKTATLTLVKKA